MAKSKKKQREKAFKIFEGNEAAQKALKKAFQKSGSSSDKITNKEVQAIIAAGGTEGQIKQLVDRVQSSGGRLRIGGAVNTYKDITKIFNPNRDQPSPSGMYDAEGNPVDLPTIDIPDFPDYSGQISDALSSADKNYTDLVDQMKIDREAMEERQRTANLISARRMRAAGRTPNLQIRGAGETPETAGTQGFRRRREQFKKKRFRGLAQIAAQGAANQLVNI